MSSIEHKGRITHPKEWPVFKHLHQGIGEASFTFMGLCLTNILIGHHMFAWSLSGKGEVLLMAAQGIVLLI